MCVQIIKTVYIYARGLISLMLRIVFTHASSACSGRAGRARENGKPSVCAKRENARNARTAGKRREKDGAREDAVVEDGRTNGFELLRRERRGAVEAAAAGRDVS